MAKKKLWVSNGMKARLQGTIRQGRRETLYRMLMKKHDCVPCFVCLFPVQEQHATLEHIIPRSAGGTDDMDNLSISHNVCNEQRGNMLCDSPEFFALREQITARRNKTKRVKL